MPRSLLLALALAAAAGGSSAAQEAGGVRPAAGTAAGPVGLTQPLPVVYQAFTPAEIHQGATATLTGHVGVAAVSRQAAHRDRVARLRGDGGYLDGFFFGQPVAASRLPPLPPLEPVFNYVALQPVLIDNFGGPIAVTNGDGNVIQQQSASGPGPIAQQQVATVSRRKKGDPEGSAAEGLAISPDGGGINLVTGRGNIIQRAPAYGR
jgi:hypothetical protein